MSMLRSLRIRLRQTDVGSLFALDDGRVYFRFDDAYAADPSNEQIWAETIPPTRRAEDNAREDPFICLLSNRSGLAHKPLSPVPRADDPLGDRAGDLWPTDYQARFSNGRVWS